MKKSQLFQECFGVKNLKEAYFYAKNNLNSNNFSSLPFGTGICDIIKIYGDSFFQSLSDTILENGTYEPDKPCYMQARKDASFGIRPICLPSFIDRLLYQAILNRGILGNIIEDRLLDTCYANRINRVPNDKSDDDFLPKDYLPQNFIEHYKIPFSNYEGAIRESLELGYTHLARLDIEGFFENINIDELQRILLEDFGVDKDIVEMLVKMLKKWTEFGSDLGIPQGLDPSSVLANVFLDSLDRAITKEFGDTIKYVRYTDDITILAKTPGVLYESVDFTVQHLRKKALKSNSKSGVYLNASEEDLNHLLKMVSLHQSDESTFSPKYDVNSVFEKISCNKMPSTVHKSGINYYLKCGYYRNEKYNSENIKYFALLLEKYPLVMNSLFHFFLKPHENGVFRVQIPINENVVYGAVFDLYQLGHLSSWRRFSVLKLLCFSTKSLKNDEFYKFILNEFQNLDDIFQQVLFLKFSFEEGAENEDIKKLLASKSLKVFISDLKNKSYAPVILSTIFWIFRHEHELIKSDIQNYSSHPSLELQTITYHFSQIYGIKLHNIEQKGELLRRLHGIKIEREEVLQKGPQITNTISIDILLMMEKTQNEFEKNKKLKGNVKQKVIFNGTHLCHGDNTVKLGKDEIKLCKYFLHSNRADAEYEEITQFVYGKSKRGPGVFDTKLKSLYKTVNEKAKKIGLSDQLFSSVSGVTIKNNLFSA